MAARSDDGAAQIAHKLLRLGATRIVDQRETSQKVKTAIGAKDPEGPSGKEARYEDEAAMGERREAGCEGTGRRGG